MIRGDEGVSGYEHRSSCQLGMMEDNMYLVEDEDHEDIISKLPWGN